ncbi:unnamed protein product, partial [Rotaria magnacalcarata]
TETCMRSELENEMLALELVNDRVRLKSNLDQADERIEKLTRELQATRSIVKESEQHTFRLNEESENIRDAFRRTCDELQQTQKIVTEYKQICSQLNDQLDKQKERYNNKIETIQVDIIDFFLEIFAKNTTNDQYLFTFKKTIA